MFRQAVDKAVGAFQAATGEHAHRAAAGVKAAQAILRQQLAAHLAGQWFGVNIGPVPHTRRCMSRLVLPTLHVMRFLLFVFVVNDGTYHSDAHNGGQCAAKIIVTICKGGGRAKSG